MPRNVRNFWIELEVDGRKTPIAVGPAAADGGFKLTVKMREHGHVSDRVLVVRGYVIDADAHNPAVVLRALAEENGLATPELGITLVASRDDLTAA